ncbi:unnamed protein product [Blepharisma stoltei]|uniref:Receptor ligand binding region domain-containing protein n=1 Tax=Blepharisma stoltei TaxID=1481888 RepID=A0AAU9K894_9CILI|nr:unnamed protein product [Blepharisma stoltei]
MLIFYLQLSLAASQFTTIPALFSKNTSPLIVNYFKSTLECSLNYTSGCNLGLPFLYSVYEIDDFSDFDQIFTSDSNYLFVYDGTWSISLSTLISEYARNYGFIHFIIDYSPEKPLPYVYYSFYSLSTHALSALAIARAYSVKKAIAVISSEFIKIDFSVDEEVEIVAQFVLTELVTYDYVYWLFSKKIKPLGVKWLFFKTNTRISKLIQEAIVRADMDKEGYTFLYIEEAAWGAYLEGSILLEEKWFHSTDFYSYTYQLVVLGTALYYGVMENTNIQASYSAYEIYNLVSREISPETAGFTIWNIQSPGNFTPVGYFNNKGLKIYAPIMFPGGTYNFPNNEKLKIPISINKEDSKYDGRNVMNQDGAMFAIDTIEKKENLLPNFDITVNSITDCDFKINSSKTCFLNHTDELGYFHIPPTESSMTLQTIEAFQALNISTPIIGVETSTQTSNSKYYPQYARVSYPNSRTASASALILSVFGISKCSLLYSDSVWGEDFSEQFENQTESYGIKILNKNRVIPLGYDGIDKKSIKEIIERKSRYVILEVQQPDIFYVIEAFYDLGMREGDIYLIVGDGMVSISDLDEKEIGTSSYNKRKEIMNGLLYISFLAFESQVGADVKNNFLSEYGHIHDYMCLFYDATYLGIQTLSALIDRGINLDSYNIQKIVREVKFAGCSGVIRVSQDGNDKLTINLGIYNLIYTNSTWSMNLCGLYDPSQLIVLQIKEELSWTASGQIPSDIIGDDQECPFRSIQVKSFEYGYIILIIVEIVPFIIGIGFLTKFYHFVFIEKFPKLLSVEKENLLDLVSYLIMAIESLQYMQIGPDFTVFFPQWSNVTKLSTLNISGWFKKGFFTFWNQVQLFDSLSLGWCVLFISKRFITANTFQILNELNLWFLPIVGDILFLPISLYLFQTFQCTSSIGDNFKDSFHDEYCSTFCWQGEHTYYAIISLIAICLYTPASLYYRFTWKNNLSFHFKEQKFHYAVKSFVQMTLIVLYTIVRPASENIFLGLGIGLLLFYLTISIFQQPFTYDRASLWYIIFLACSLLVWICCALAKLNKNAALAIVLAGWLMLAIAGAIYQKLYLPSLLESLKGQDIHKLFRFQLFSISPEQAGISKKVNYEYVRDIIQGNNVENKYKSNPIDSSALDEEILKSSMQSLEVSI